MAKVTIEQVSNGFIVYHQTGLSSIQVYQTVDEVFEHLLQIFEGRTKHFNGEAFGEVIVKRWQAKPDA